MRKQEEVKEVTGGRGSDMRKQEEVEEMTGG
jgi:hypothetical protein